MQLRRGAYFLAVVSLAYNVAAFFVLGSLRTPLLNVSNSKVGNTSDFQEKKLPQVGTAQSSLHTTSAVTPNPSGLRTPNKLTNLSRAPPVQMSDIQAKSSASEMDSRTKAEWNLFLQKFEVAGKNTQSLCQGGKYCQFFTAPNDVWVNKDCFNQTLSLIKHGLVIRECRCRILGKGEANQMRNALSSLAGSGNTWVRQLLEAATGVCTSSMWCDPVLRGLKFCVEGVTGTETLVVKNHDSNIRWRGDREEKQLHKPEFDSAILVHRNPYKAAVAEWNRALGFEIANARRHNVTVEGVPDDIAKGVSLNAHIETFGPEFFGTNSGWEKIVRKQLQEWEKMISHFIVNNTQHPVLVVNYDRLRSNTLTEMKRMLNFLSFPFDAGEIQTRLKETNLDTFRRKDSNVSFEHFTAEQKVFVNAVILRVIDKLKSAQSQFDIPLGEYIRN